MRASSCCFGLSTYGSRIFFFRFFSGRTCRRAVRHQWRRHFWAKKRTLGMPFEGTIPSREIYHLENRWHNSHMGVSQNNGTPKSSILIGFSIINHPFWGTTIFENTHIYVYIYIVYMSILVYQGPLTKLGHRTWEWLAASHLLSLGGVCGILIGRLMNSNKNSLLFFGGGSFWIHSIVSLPWQKSASFEEGMVICDS